jgi:hypothetical protein
MTRPAVIPAPPHTSARPGTYQKFATMPPASSSVAGAPLSAAAGGLSRASRDERGHKHENDDSLYFHIGLFSWRARRD